MNEYEVIQMIRRSKLILVSQLRSLAISIRSMSSSIVRHFLYTSQPGAFRNSASTNSSLGMSAYASLSSIIKHRQHTRLRMRTSEGQERLNAMSNYATLLPRLLRASILVRMNASTLPII